MKIRAFELEDCDCSPHEITANYYTVEGEFVCFWYESFIVHLFRNPRSVIEIRGNDNDSDEYTDRRNIEAE